MIILYMNYIMTQFKSNILSCLALIVKLILAVNVFYSLKVEKEESGLVELTLPKTIHHFKKIISEPCLVQLISI